MAQFDDDKNSLRGFLLYHIHDHFNNAGITSKHQIIYSHLLSPIFFKSIYLTVPRSPIKDVRPQLTTLINSDPKTADQNPLTLKPGITPETIISMRAFITNVKNPRLRTFMGSVNINNIGRKKAFSMLKIAAAKNAEINPLTYIPSSK